MPAVAAASSRPSLSLPTGRTLVLLEPLGRGRLARVFRGYVEGGLGMRRTAAIKVFDPFDAEGGDFEGLAEVMGAVARAQGRLDHPSVVRLYDAALVEGQAVLVHELVRGVSLRRLLTSFRERHLRVPLDVALGIALDVADGLAAARVARDAEGVLAPVHHLGLGTQEILLSWAGEVKVSDFQCARLSAASSGVRSRASFRGQVDALSPEVAVGAPPDARTDVFALGLVLRELLVGPRFPEGIARDEALRLAREGWVQPSTFGPRLDPELDDLVCRATAVDPDDRPQHAGLFASELRRIAMRLGAGGGRTFLAQLLEREIRDAEPTSPGRPALVVT